MPNKKEECARIKKPQMYGMSVQYGKKTIATGILSAAIAGILMKVFFVNRRRSAYKKFYE